jgi:hypothetical protein
MSEPQTTVSVPVDTFVMGADMYVGSNPHKVRLNLMPDGTVTWKNVMAYDHTTIEPEGPPPVVSQQIGGRDDREDMGR